MIVGGKLLLEVNCFGGLPIFRAPGGGTMDPTRSDKRALTEEERRIYDRLGEVFEEERLRMAKALAGAGSQWFGRAEYELRDQVHRLGARALEAAADERQKKGWL